MEPIAAQNHPIAIRPAGSGPQATELSSLLKDGRVLAGEVLQSLSDGSIMVGIGRHKVPAQTHLRMDPGHRFLFQVQHAGAQVLLRILGSGSGEGGEFWRFLREVIGQDRPIGELLGELAGRLRTEMARPGADLEALGRLAQNIESHAQAPTGGADAGARLAQLFRAAGLRYEALLLGALGRGFDQEVLRALGRDLKSKLLRAFGDLPDGPVKDAVARALAGIEAEQLLNVARAHSGEPQVLSLPLPDEHGWTTARLIVPGRSEEDERGGDRGSEDGEEPQRYTLGVTFSRTGPLRADVVWAKDMVTVRLLTERPEVAERMRADAAGLAERLGTEARAVRIAVGLGGKADLAVGLNLNEIPLLRENHIMDISG